MAPQYNQLPRAVVIGLDSMQGLQAARILAGRGVPVISIARDPSDFRCRTKVCEKILFADTKGEELIRALEELGPQLRQKAVLFPSIDMAVLLVSRHRDRLDPWFHIVLPGHDVVEMLLDKPRFNAFSTEKGLRVPVSFLLNTRGDAERAARELRYPCILKPSKKTSLWDENTRKKAFKLHSAEEFLASYDTCSGWAEGMIVQESVEGGDSNLFACNCYFDSRSNPVITFVSRKIRQWPPETGNGCLREEYRNDEVVATTVELFRGVGYSGLGYLEFKLDSRTGEYVIIEPNVGRPTGGSAIAEAGGVELLYTMYCDAVGLPRPQNLQQSYRGVKWAYLVADLQSALYYFRRGELSPQEWWRSWQGIGVDALLSWRDPGPVLALVPAALGRLANYLRNRERARYRPARQTSSTTFRGRRNI